MTDIQSLTPLIEGRGLHTYYGNSHVLHGVDFRIHPGETLALLGRNGMGKTTTIRSLLGFTPPKRGEVSMRGEKVTGKLPHQIIRQGIGYGTADGCHWSRPDAQSGSDHSG